MSNGYFRFKQFCLEQDRCAMKVSTDACIQGAWTPLLSTDTRILDIGCGTGLLSLMLAQRQAVAAIDAIELNEAAALQAQENVQASPWADRITVMQGDARSFTATEKYDLVICNPPFFNNSLLGPAQQRNQARHTLSFGYEDLLDCLQRNFSGKGRAAVLLPAAEHLLWEQLLAKNNWHIIQLLYVSPRVGAAPNRVVSICAREHAPCRSETLFIRREDNQYTDAFTALLRDFYLYL